MLSNFQKNKKDVVFRNALKSVLLWLLLLTILGFLVITNVKIKARRDKLYAIIDNLKKEVQEIEKKNNDLKWQASQMGSREYLEKIAREQFNLKAPGEEVVVISRDNDEPQQSETENFPEGKKEKKINLWNPLNWLGSIKNFLSSF